MSKKHVIIVVLSVVVITTLIIGVMLIGKINNQNSTDPTTSTTNNDNPTSPSESNPATEDIPDSVAGLPGHMFETTSNMNFDFKLTNTNTGESYNLKYGFKCNAIVDSFIDMWEEYVKASGETFIDDEVAPTTTHLKVYGHKDLEDGIFCFGGVNLSQEITVLDECMFVFVSYEGSDQWSIMGVKAGMSKDEITASIGAPTQEFDSDFGHTLEYYIYEDGHAYILSIHLDLQNNKVYKMSLNIDNYPVHAGNVA